MVPHESELLKHEKLLHIICMKYYTVKDMTVMYKYTYQLIHKSAFTEYTHQICDKKLEITVSVYVI